MFTRGRQSLQMWDVHVANDVIELFLQRRGLWPNQGAAANRRPAGQSDGSDNVTAIVAADRAFPAAVAELGRRRRRHTP